MRTRLGVIAAALFLLAACTSSVGTPVPTSASVGTPVPTSASVGTPVPTSASTAPSGAATAPASVLVTVVQNVTYGPVLTGPSGGSLYVRIGVGTALTVQPCTGGCRTAWPPLLVAPGGSVTGDAHVPAGSLGTVVRSDDGSTQVTYMGIPLYYWTGDTKPGDVTGSSVNGFLVATTSAFETMPAPCPSACDAEPAPSPAVSAGY